MKAIKGMRVPDTDLQSDHGNLSLDYPPGRAGSIGYDGTPPVPFHGYESGACTNEVVLETQPPKK